MPTIKAWSCANCGCGDYTEKIATTIKLWWGFTPWTLFYNCSDLFTRYLKCTMVKDGSTVTIEFDRLNGKTTCTADPAIPETGCDTYPYSQWTPRRADEMPYATSISETHIEWSEGDYMDLSIPYILQGTASVEEDCDNLLAEITEAEMKAMAGPAVTNASYIHPIEYNDVISWPGGDSAGYPFGGLFPTCAELKRLMDEHDNWDDAAIVAGALCPLIGYQEGDGAISAAWSYLDKVNLAWWKSKALYRRVPGSHCINEDFLSPLYGADTCYAVTADEDNDVYVLPAIFTDLTAAGSECQPTVRRHFHPWKSPTASGGHCPCV